MSTNYVKAVLFDLDGTLIDTAADFTRIIGRMSEKMVGRRLPVMLSVNKFLPVQELWLV